MTDEEIRAEDDLLITNDVARAVEENEFVPYVQPLYNMAHNKVVGAEALVRWTLSDDGTVIPAALFVPSLEHTHTICGLDWFMIDEITKFLGDSADTPACVPIALNISRQHSEDPDFAKRLAATADWHKVPHGFVCVELSEATLLDGDEDVRRLATTSLAEGFVVSVDNLEKGVSGLRTLAKWGIRNAKVSAMLWRQRPKELPAVVSAARELGIELCAERVERPEEVQMLIEAGVPAGMGYRFAQPMGLGAFAKLCQG